MLALVVEVGALGPWKIPSHIWLWVLPWEAPSEGASDSGAQFHQMGLLLCMCTFQVALHLQHVVLTSTSRGLS